MGKLDGKVAIVTGGTRGIGKAICERFAEEGASLVIVGRSAKQEMADEFVAKGTQAIAVAADVSNPADADAVVKAAVEAFGQIDILVNNAGITRDGLLMRMSEDDWDQVMDINLKGCFNFTKAVARPMMKKRAGRIVNMASVIGRMGNAGQANYAASKAGMIGFTKSTAKELAARGINVNVVAPGFIETEMTDAMTEQAREAVLAGIPSKKMGTTKNIADVVAFLSSDESAYITGQVIGVDGGLYM